MSLISYKELPIDAYKVTSGTNFYFLKERKKKLTLENIEIPIGLTYLIYSPFSVCYFERKVSEKFDVKEYKDLIRQGRIFILPTEEDKDNTTKMLNSLNLNYQQLQDYIKALFLFEYYRYEGVFDVHKREQQQRIGLYLKKIERNVQNNLELKNN